MTNAPRSITVELPYPHKFLWPNGTPISKHAKNDQFQKHKGWAFNATWAACGRLKPIFPDGKIPVHVDVMRKSSGPFPDEDNTVASLKAYLDGICLKLGINDVRLRTPTLALLSPITGRFVITIGKAE